MRQFRARITGQTPIGDALLVSLTATEMPEFRAGQFLLARAGESYEPYLRRAYFPIVVPKGQSAHTGAPHLLVPAGADEGMRRGTESRGYDIIAPIGNGFTLHSGTRRLLLVGDGAQLAPLIALAHTASEQQIAVTLLVQTSASDDRPILEALLPLEVEYQLADDLAGALAPPLAWCDQVCVAGDAALVAQIRNAIAHYTAFDTEPFAQALVMPTIGCGFGACLGCAVETTRGLKLACVDGPVFDLLTLA